MAHRLNSLKRMSKGPSRLAFVSDILIEAGYLVSSLMEVGLVSLVTVAGATIVWVLTEDMRDNRRKARRRRPRDDSPADGVSHTYTHSCQVFCLRVLRAERRKDVSGETVLITGASRGIGRCLALEFAKHGASTIVLWGRDEEKLSSVKKEVEEIGKTVCHFYRCDVGDREQVYRTMQKVQENVGKITILVNNAGVVHGGALLETKDDNIEDTLRVNTLSHFWTTKSVLPSMLANGRGHVVGIASTLGLFALPGVSDYVTSKFSVVGFYESLAAELIAQGRRDVGVTCVCPGHTTTDMFKDLTTQSFSLTPQQVAEQTVDAVKTNQRRVILPRIMHLTWILNSWLPASWMRTVLYVTGAMKDMENFCAKR